MPRWPKDNQAARNAFYGDPAKGEIAPQMVPVTPPFAMFYEGRKIKTIMFHRLAAASLLAALNEIWDFYGRDQARVDAAGLSKYNGAYNPRMVRGSATKWSNHAYAAAIDINADQNAMYAAGNMPQAAIDAFCRQGAMWGGWYTGRKDAMHFEFVDNGGRQPKSAAPVFTPVAHLFEEPDAAPSDQFDDEHADDHEDETAPAPRPMATSKIGVTQIATGGIAGVIGAGQATSAIVGQVNDVASQVSTVTNQAGSVIEQTRTVIAVPKPGFWFGVLHVVTSPVFVACVCLAIVTACALTWLWRREHAKAGI